MAIVTQEENIAFGASIGLKIIPGTQLAFAVIRNTRHVSSGAIRAMAERNEGECTWCCSECKKPRTRWCSKECVEAYNAHMDGAHIRKLVLIRDGGICCLCGSSQDWEADHIIPVCEGGGCCGIDNYRTLCGPCHLLATKDLWARLKRKRKQESDRLDRLSRATT